MGRVGSEEPRPRGTGTETGHRAPGGAHIGVAEGAVALRGLREVVEVLAAAARVAQLVRRGADAGGAAAARVAPEREGASARTVAVVLAPPPAEARLALAPVTGGVACEPSAQPSTAMTSTMAKRSASESIWYSCWFCSA